MTDWAAAAVGLGGIGVALSQNGDPGLMGMAPILASVLAWSLHRLDRTSAAGVVLVLGCVAAPIAGAFTPIAEQSAIAEVMWLTVGTVLGAFLLSSTEYAVTAAVVIFAEAMGLAQNPAIPAGTPLYICGALSVVAMLGLVGLRLVEEQDDRAAAHAAELESALAKARSRAEALADAQLDLKKTRRQLVHLGRLASLGEASAQMAHELNNPLTTVLMCSEVLRDELRTLHPELATVSGDLYEAALACQGVTDRVLWYGRRERNEPLPVSLRQVVERAITITRARMRRANCHVSVMVCPDAVVLGDPVQLTQVLVNLLVNGLSVMPATGGEISVRGGVHQERVWLTVTDEGPGVPPDIADQIFEPFFSTRIETGGSGLGLAISRAVIEDHGGTLTLETCHPEPARFRIELADDVSAGRLALAPPETSADAPTEGGRPAGRSYVKQRLRAIAPSPAEDPQDTGPSDTESPADGQPPAR